MRNYNKLLYIYLILSLYNCPCMQGQYNTLGTILPQVIRNHKQLNVKIPFFENLQKIDLKNSNLDWEQLQNYNFNNNELDYLAHQFCKLVPTAHVVIIWSKGISSKQYITSELKKCGKIIYVKQLHLKGKALHYLLKSIPEKSNSVDQHVEYYFNNRPETDLIALVCTFPNLNTAVQCKNKIRKHLKLNPPISALHIADTQDQSIELAKIFFNQNTIQYLNSGLLSTKHHKFNFLFKKYKQCAQLFGFDLDYCCIDGSSVLAIHGLRDVNVDFDFLSYHQDLRLSNVKYRFQGTMIGPIELHNKAWISARVDHLETIFDPHYYFYYQGMKCTTLERLRLFKHNQNREIDKKDVKGIDQILSKLS